MLAASAAAQTCDISAATQLLEDNLGVYPESFVRDLAADARFEKLFENSAVIIHRVPPSPTQP